MAVSSAFRTWFQKINNFRIALHRIFPVFKVSAQPNWGLHRVQYFLEPSIVTLGFREP